MELEGRLDNIRRGSNRKQWSARACPACECMDGGEVFSKFSVVYVRCEQCGTTYINPVPGEEELQVLYDASGQLVHGDSRRIDLDFKPSRYRREEEVLSVRSGRLLDVGCATGSFLNRAQELGFDEAVGIDISLPDIEYARRRGYNVYRGDFRSLSLESESFDVVTCWATLEHVRDPLAFCRESFRVLKPGGLIALSVPSGGGLSFRLLGRKWHMVGVDHLNYFTLNGVRRMLSKSGFSIESFVTQSFNPLKFLRDLRGRHLSGEMTDQDLVTDSVSTVELRTRKSVKILERVIDAAVRRFGCGDLLLIAGRKTD